MPVIFDDLLYRVHFTPCRGFAEYYPCCVSARAVYQVTLIFFWGVVNWMEGGTFPSPHMRPSSLGELAWSVGCCRLNGKLFQYRVNCTACGPVFMFGCYRLCEGHISVTYCRVNKRSARPISGSPRLAGPGTEHWGGSPALPSGEPYRAHSPQVFTPSCCDRGRIIPKVLRRRSIRTFLKLMSNRPQDTCLTIASDRSLTPVVLSPSSVLIVRHIRREWREVQTPSHHLSLFPSLRQVDNMRSTAKELEIQLSVRERELLEEALRIVDCRGKNQREIMCCGLIQCHDCPFGIVIVNLKGYLDMKDGKFLVHLRQEYDSPDD